MDKTKKSTSNSGNNNNNNAASKVNDGNNKNKMTIEYYNSITTFTTMPGTPQNLLYPIQPSASSSGGGGVKIPKDLLDDLASRFIINIPDHERSDMIRVCFQIELAHWFYLDFMLPTNNENVKKLPSCGIKQFTWQIFNHVPFLRPQIGNVDKIIEDWKSYKLSVPTYGAILMSKTENSDTQVLLVQSFWSKCSFGFPKGKINENEDPVKCAIREVYEETGYDITKLIDPNEYIELYINLQYTRLYLVPNVPNDPETVFEPKTRNEIKCCKWFSVQQLPTNKNESKIQNANSFFMIFPFIKRLKRWLAERQTDKLTVAGNNSPKMFTYSTPDNVNMSVVKRQRNKSQGSLQESTFGKSAVASSPYQDVSISSILGKGNKIKRKLNYDATAKSNKQKPGKAADMNHKKFEFNQNVTKMMTDFQFDRLAIIMMAMKT